MNTINKLLQAARFAAEKHTGQNRKGASARPYINHPIEVADLAANTGLVEDVDVIIACLLHDTVEDCGVEPQTIAELFGDRVRGFVLEVTDDKTLPKERRKELQILHAPTLSREAKVIKLADKISNVTEMVADAPDGWDMDRRRAYVSWADRVVAGLRGVNAPLESLFDSVSDRARTHLA